jgi:hypothetical protein
MADTQFPSRTFFPVQTVFSKTKMTQNSHWQYFFCGALASCIVDPRLIVLGGLGFLFWTSANPSEPVQPAMTNLLEKTTFWIFSWAKPIRDYIAQKKVT